MGQALSTRSAAHPASFPLHLLFEFGVVVALGCLCIFHSHLTLSFWTARLSPRRALTCIIARAARHPAMPALSRDRVPLLVRGAAGRPAGLFLAAAQHHVLQVRGHRYHHQLHLLCLRRPQGRRSTPQLRCLLASRSTFRSFCLFASPSTVHTYPLGYIPGHPQGGDQDYQRPARRARQVVAGLPITVLCRSRPSNAVCCRWSVTLQDEGDQVPELMPGSVRVGLRVAEHAQVRQLQNCAVLS